MTDPEVDEVDPGTPDMDVSMYEQGDLFDTTEHCGPGGDL